ncbi:MAG: hypothetical protein ACETWG_11690 [Candidatus Neomarinimicrobiota bacterium]
MHKSRQHTIPLVILLLVCLFTAKVYGQASTSQPLSLTLAFTGQSSGDATKPNVQLTLTNVSGRSFQVLQPRT